MHSKRKHFWTLTLLFCHIVRILEVTLHLCCSPDSMLGFATGTFSCWCFRHRVERRTDGGDSSVFVSGVGRRTDGGDSSVFVSAVGHPTDGWDSSVEWPRRNNSEMLKNLEAVRQQTLATTHFEMFFSFDPNYSRAELSSSIYSNWRSTHTVLVAAVECSSQCHNIYSIWRSTHTVRVAAVEYSSQCQNIYSSWRSTHTVRVPAVECSSQCQNLKSLSQAGKKASYKWASRIWC